MNFSIAGGYEDLIFKLNLIGEKGISAGIDVGLNCHFELLKVNKLCKRVMFEILRFNLSQS